MQPFFGVPSGPQRDAAGRRRRGGDEAADGHGRVEGASAYRPALRFSEDEAISEPRNVKKLLNFAGNFMKNLSEKMYALNPSGGNTKFEGTAGDRTEPEGNTKTYRRAAARTSVLKFWRAVAFLR